MCVYYNTPYLQGTDEETGFCGFGCSYIQTEYGNIRCICVLHAEPETSFLFLADFIPIYNVKIWSALELLFDKLLVALSKHDGILGRRGN